MSLSKWLGHEVDKTDFAWGIYVTANDGSDFAYIKYIVAPHKNKTEIRFSYI